MNVIYALLHPRTSEIRYIGKTQNVNQRYQQHCHTRNNTYVSNWIFSLRKEGLYPAVITLESGLSKEEWPEAEQFWIAYFRSLGARLTNITDGGHHVVCKRVEPKQCVEDELTLHLFSPLNGETIYLFVKLTEEMKGWIKENEERVAMLERWPSWFSNGFKGGNRGAATA